MKAMITKRMKSMDYKIASFFIKGKQTHIQSKNKS
jgi:hypothetical protein